MAAKKKRDTSNEQLFRTSALSKLSSPEHLDKLIRITDSKGWLSLAGAVFLIVLIVIWSVIGELPTKVYGSGVLIRSGGLRSIQHQYGGYITDLAVKEGSIVEKGDVLARLAANDLIAQISNARFELKTMEDGFTRYAGYFEENNLIKREYFKRARESGEERLKDLNRNIEDAQKKIKFQASLLEKGGISGEEIKLSQQQLDTLESSKAGVENELKSIIMEELAFEKQHQETSLQKYNEIAEKKKQISYLQDQLDERSKIVSPYSGRVSSVNVERGSIISPGEIVMSVELEGKDIKNLEALIFIPAMEAKKIELGMEAQISPSTVNSSEYGVMLGRVTGVDEYPASFQYIAKTVGEELARTYSQMRDPVEVIVDFIPDPSSETGYRWSSRQGPPVKIKSGTPASGGIVVKRQKPITLVFPILAKWLD